MSELAADKVTFSRPFRLPGMDTPHAPGTFALAIDRRELDVWWPAYRVTMTLMLPAGASLEAWSLTPTELETALAADRAGASPNLPAETAVKTARR